MPRETEAKIKVHNLEPYRATLDQLGAANEGECLERNWVFDTALGDLRGDGILLRIRNTGGPGGVLTVKRRVQGGEFKTREEIESMVDSTEDLMRQLEIVGFQVKWVYEKYRETWIWRDCVVTLDECPEIGYFIEIEGSPGGIRSVAAELGLDPNQHIADTYLGLWQKFLEENGEAPRNMIFTREKTEEYRRRSTTVVFRRENGSRPSPYAGSMKERKP
ncbi:MAG: class IV adenylate cyclase [Planctomycetes bacterium]|nr:class IV adenylate cyclase [Planctomycetota bacterium]